MEQNIIQIGNSNGLILPKQLLDELNLKPGDTVTIEKDVLGESLTISKKGTISKYPQVRPEFMKVLEKVHQKYGEAFKELAKK